MSEEPHVIYVCQSPIGGDVTALSARIDTVHSAAELSALLRDHEPAVVVSEYALDSRETGLDVLSRVRRTAPEVPFVLCTDEPDGEVASAATRLGVSEYVPRCGDAETDLADRIEPYIEGQQDTSTADDNQGTLVADGNPGMRAAGGLPGDPPADPVSPTHREPELERVNRRLDLALDSMDAGVFVWDGTTGEVVWDETTADLFGLEPRRRTLDEGRFFEHVAPDDRDRVRAAVADALDGTDEVAVEYRVAVSDGGPRWLATDAEVVRTADGSVDRIVGITRDVTERKHRQQDLERYETIMETIDDGVYSLDDEGRFTFANEALADLTGHSVSELLGRHVSIVKGDQTVKLGEEVLGQMLSEGIDQTTFEFDLEHADGRRIPFEDRLTLLPFEDGEFTGTAGVFRDISTHKRRETMLTSLMETTRELMQAPTKQAVADIVVEAANSVLGFDLNLVRLYDAERDVLEPVAGTDATYETLGDRPLYEPGEDVPGDVFETGDSVFYSDDDLSVEDGPVDEIFCLPLGEHGTLSLSARAKQAFDELDQQVAEILALNARAALDRAEREEELSRYETVMETVQHMVYVVDEDGRFTMVTAPLADRLGYDRRELLGQPAHDFVVSDDDNRFEDAIAGLRANPELPSELVETESVTADGERFPVSVEVSLLPGDRLAGSVGVVQELTELEQTREQLRDERDRFSYLFDNIPDAVVDTKRVDGESIVQATNPAFEAVFGYEREAVVGAAIADYVLSETGESVRDRYGEPLPWGAVETTGVRRQTADGDRHFLFRGIPYRVDEDETRAFSIYTDITEQKRRQRQLEVLNRVLRHNIRNDLTVVLGHADQLQYELDDQEHLALVDRLIDNARSIVSMSETVRDIERTIERSTETHATDAADAIDAVVADARSDYPDAEFVVDAPPDLRGRANEQLRVALGNLVENAVEHNDSPTPRVRIVATATTDDPDTIAISVADNGPGIPEHERAIVAGDQSITQLNHASGLGLWLVRWIVDSLGGELSFAERPSGGTTVRIELQRPSSGR